MRVTIHYDDLEVEGEILDDYQPSNAISPSTHWGTTTMDFDYTITVDEEVIYDYLVEQVGSETFRGFTKEKQNGFFCAIQRAFLEDMFNEDSLQDNKDFMEWIKDKYRDDAQYECHQAYDD